MIGSEQLSLMEIEAWRSASQGVAFQARSRAELYNWVGSLLCQQEYACQPKRVRGLLRAYLERMSGLSRAQCMRLIGQYLKCGEVKLKSQARRRFAVRYTAADVESLAMVDRAHERLSGPATRHILRREFEVYGKPEFERLARISKPTTDRSSSTRRWPSCWASCSSSRPGAVPATRATTAWSRPGTPPSCASIWASDTSIRPRPSASASSTPASSTPR